jgi:hypothetical protein
MDITIYCDNVTTSKFGNGLCVELGGIDESFLDNMNTLEHAMNKHKLNDILNEISTRDLIDHVMKNYSSEIIDQVMSDHHSEIISRVREETCNNILE